MYGYETTDQMVPLIDQEQYTSHKYNQTTTINNVRSISNNNNDYFERISNNDANVSFDGIPPHPTIEYSRHISTISGNILNTNQNSLSSLDIRYIAYFYSVFPLHLYTFNTLFGDVINPKLSELTKSVSEFKLFPSYILNNIIPLHHLNSSLNNIDFHSISNFLPSEPFYFEFIILIKKDLNSIISKFDLTTTTHIINFILYKIISKFHKNLESVSKPISSKLDDHIKQIESNINIIMRSLNGSFIIITSEIDEIKIDTHISNLHTNHKSLNKFDKYKKENDLIKLANPFQPHELRNLGPIYLRLTLYKERMRSHSSIRTSLNQLKHKLNVIKNISDQICSKIKDCESNLPQINEIDKLLMLTLYLKYNIINKLHSHIAYFYRLEQIGNHISSLKGSCYSKELKDKLDPEFCSAVNSLKEIKLIPREIHSKIYNIRVQIVYIVAELQLLKSLLQYRDSLEIISTWSEKLPFLIKNNVYEFLKDSKKIIETLSETSKRIETTSEEIDKLKSKNPYLSKFVPEDLQNLKSCISQIPYFIKQVTLYLRIIRYIICELQIIKSNSTTSVKEIKTKIDLMSDLSSGLKQLKEMYSDILKFYYIHVKTTFFLNFYSGLIKSPEFQKSLRRLNEMIYETGVFIYFITVYYAILYHINIIVKNMKHVMIEIYDLNKYNKNINEITEMVSIIINKLCVTNKNISKLESNMSGLSTNNLKDKITNHKNQVVILKQDIKEIVKTFKHTRDYIDNTAQELKKKSKEITREIQKYINYLSGIILINELLSIPSYLIKKDYQNPIIIILSEIKKYSNMVKSYIELNIINLNSKMKMLSIQIDNLKKGISEVKSNINETEIRVMDLECAIEGVARNFIRCSNKQLSTNLTIINRANNNRLIKDIGDVEVDNRVMSMYSVISVMDYKLVVNRLYDSAKKIDNIVNVMYLSYGCFCIESFEKNTAIDKSIGDLGIKEYFFRHKSSDEIYKLKTPDELKRLYGINLDLNHMCMCMVIKYSFNTQIFNLLYVISSELQMLSTMSRKFTKYSQPRSVGSDVDKILILIINLLYKICILIEYRYKSYFVVSRDPVYLKCYCTYNEDKNYQMIVSIILVLSSLMENIWSMDSERMRSSIQSLSSLIREFDIISVDNSNRSTDNNNKKFDDIITCLFCPLKFCTISSKLQLILDFVSFCYYDPILTNQIKPYTWDVKISNPDSFFSSINGFMSKINNGNKKHLESINNKFGKIDGSNNLCKQFKNQCCVLSSNIVIIVSMLISVKINIKLYPAKCKEIKERLCCFLKSMCKCDKNDCCLKNLLESTSQICNNGNVDSCDCQELLKKCVDVCCDDKCCSVKCPCNEIKTCCDQLKKLCCENNNNGLCKIIETIQKCGSQCTVKKSRDGGCICVCCRVVIKSILILQNMFDNSVLIISKNITVSCKYILEIMDKIKKTNNSDIIIKSIVKNNNRYNKVGISIVKHNYINSNSHVSTNNISLTNVETRNWGYDTRYEHDVGTDKGFGKGDGYPNLIDSRYTFSHLPIFP